MRAWRLPLAMLGFLALMFQSFVIQTHIHIPQGTGKAQTVSLITLAAAAFAEKAHAAGDVCAEAPHDKYPIGEDPSNCPLCQEVTNSGAYLHNAASVCLLPPSANVHVIVFADALPSSFRVSHIWQGRAPPTV